MKSGMKTLIILILVWAVLLPMTAIADNPWHIDVRAGYSLGGTAPVGLPASIRKLNSYKLTPSFMAGADVQREISGPWGVMAGLRIENKGMDEDAKVKNYHLTMIRGGESLEGRFTGNVRTKVKQWMFTIPVQATFTTGKVRIKAGPYVSWLFSKSFEGRAHSGYLRVGNPTGAKVIIGSTKDTRGSYDFSDNMRRMQVGVGAGADWQAFNKTMLFAELNWGLSGIHHSSFKTIEQTLYPIYATVGVAYKMK